MQRQLERDRERDDDRAEDQCQERGRAVADVELAEVEAAIGAAVGEFGPSGEEGGLAAARAQALERDLGDRGG